ncbi:MAG: SDR family NAD(P)-dependent oxidoreductase [Dehalococcoidia bacterium]
MTTDAQETLDLGLAGKVAIVTGAARGIGNAVATSLARAGARVVLNDYGVALDGTALASEPKSSRRRRNCVRPATTSNRYSRTCR